MQPGRLLAGLRVGSALCLLLLLPFSMSCDLGQLGLALQNLAKGLSAESLVARADFSGPAGDSQKLAQRKEIVTFLRHYSTGLSRFEEVLLADAIVRASRRNRTDYRLILAVIKTESTFSNWAISPRGAFGLMQVRPATGRSVARKLRLPWAGHASLFDPATNVRIGTAYLADLRSRFGDLRTALMAYNRGPGAVEGNLDLDPYTDPYVLKVMSQYRRFLRATRRADAAHPFEAPST